MEFNLFRQDNTSQNSKLKKLSIKKLDAEFNTFLENSTKNITEKKL